MTVNFDELIKLIEMLNKYGKVEIMLNNKKVRDK